MVVCNTPRNPFRARRIGAWQWERATATTTPTVSPSTAVGKSQRGPWLPERIRRSGKRNVLHDRLRPLALINTYRLTCLVAIDYYSLGSLLPPWVREYPAKDVSESGVENQEVGRSVGRSSWCVVVVPAPGSYWELFLSGRWKLNGEEEEGGAKMGEGGLRSSSLLRSLVRRLGRQ